jgi:CelD/BcsL family acetyltransferase involved in cellulose biosynthesis
MCLPTPGVRAFLARLAMTRSTDGKPALELHGIELAGGEHEGTIIAVAGLTRKDQHVTCQFGSIDETVAADASAGELLFYRMIEQAAKEGNQVFDFGVGDQLYKRSWCPVRTDLVDCYLPLSSRAALRLRFARRDHRQTRNQDLACARQGGCLVAGGMVRRSQIPQTEANSRTDHSRSNPGQSLEARSQP